MLVSVKGKYQNGVVQPDEPIVDREGQAVIITFVEEKAETIDSNGSSGDAADSSGVSDDMKAGWDRLMANIERNTIDTGIEDLAYQHDHYIHGKPKQD